MLISCHLVSMCARHISMFSHSFVKTFHLLTLFQKAYGEIHIAPGCIERAQVR